MTSKVFITGGCGSLGKRIVRYLYDNTNCDIVVYSRDEQKHYQMALVYGNSPRITFVLGDIANKDRLHDTFIIEKPDIVIHTAAQKHVYSNEHNPIQGVITNVHGTENVARCCAKSNVKVACFVSTDKAVEPTTLYGMTKYIAERIWRNFIEKTQDNQDSTRFIGVRYGNVINSDGSLIPLFMRLAKTTQVFTVTNPDMTRFFITFEEAINLILWAVNSAYPNLIPELDKIKQPVLHDIHKGFLVPKLNSAKVGDIVEIYRDKYSGIIKEIPQAEGEKLHESMTPSYSSDMSVMTKEELFDYLNEQGLLP